MENEIESYSELEACIYQRLQTARVSERVFEIILNAYEDALEAETVEISESIEERLFRSVLNTIVKDLYRKVEE